MGSVKRRSREGTAFASAAVQDDRRRLAELEIVENVPIDGPLSATIGDMMTTEPTEHVLHEAGAPRRSPAADLMLSAESLARAAELRHAFASASDGSVVGEKLLEDLVAMEAAVALALLDSEAAAVTLLNRAMTTDPALALKVAQVAKEIVGLASAVSRRMQGGLAAAANLRAQRRLLSLQGGHVDGK